LILNWIIGYHRIINETGEILFPNSPSWGKINNDFQINLPPTKYQEKAGSKCWILVDHCYLKGKIVLVMFLWDVNNKFMLPFAFKLRASSTAIVDFDNAIQMVAELGIEPVGLVGDSAFAPVFHSSLYSNLKIVYENSLL